MRYLSPLIMRQIYYAEIEKIIKRIFNDAIYAPLMVDLSGKEVYNAILTATEAALRNGNLWYDDNKIYGRFNAAISRELQKFGAKYNARRMFWELQSALTPGMQIAIAHAEDRRGKIIRDMIITLDNIDVDKIIEKTNLQGAFSETIGKIDAEFIKKTISIAIKPKLSDVQRELLARDWANNLKLYIKKWTDEEILSLRQIVAANTLRGQRSENLEKLIQTNYQTSKAKAKFLARQETSLCMSKFQESRFKEVGVRRYRWSGADDARERHDHKLLNNKIFFFDSPPITNRKTGVRNNPGEDFGCFPGNSRVNVENIIEKCFRHWYCGELIEIVTSSGETIRATFNHPVLTQRGWKSIGLLNDSDYIFKVKNKLIDSTKSNGNKSESTIRNIFESFGKSCSFFTTPGQFEQFHGDGSAGNVDIIDTTSLLRANSNIKRQKLFDKFFFAFTDFLAASVSRFFEHLCSFDFWYIFCTKMRGFSEFLPFFKRKFTHSNYISFRSIADSDIIFNQSTTDNISAYPESFRDGKLTFTRNISVNNGSDIKLQSVAAAIPCGIISKRHAFYIGHVYNLQVDFGYYTSGDVVVSNCRCIAVPIVE